MNPSEVFLDSSILVGLNLGDENAKALVKSLIERGFTLVINPVVFDTVRITGVSPPEAIQSHHQAVHQTENEF
ncbi:MAG: uncharacterized protein PWP39_1570 [Pyrococcus sp.]|nr:uncharacterized protein [Pyrococcus sp.]